MNEAPGTPPHMAAMRDAVPAEDGRRKARGEPAAGGWFTLALPAAGH